MTDPAAPLPEDQDAPPPMPEASEPADGASEESAVPVAADSADRDSDAPPVDEEGLPEWEPLTPELVEDEAIRGDFMLRWAVILLAMLMGWTVVQETAVLTHIRSGQVLLENGLLPSGRDTLASTTAQVRWVHLSWLFDAGVAGLFAVLGESGLTLLKALLAALTFYLLSRISVPGVPTWWGSVCAALALVACFPSLTATPHLITLLGMTILLLLLHRRSVDPEARLAGPAVLTMLVWVQLDDRAWIGAAALLAYALGHQWDLRRNRDTGGTRGGSLLPAAILSLLVMLLHPFVWETWLSAVRLYQHEYPAQQTYAIRGASDYFRSFPLWSAESWTLNYFNAAALLLWGVTLVALVLNASRVRLSHLALFTAMSVVAAAGGTELAVGSIVFAALATLNAQQWYVASFRQTYSVETGELLFSRGGRALTVIALFGLGFMMVAGHLTGAGGRRVGTGFSGQLQASIDSYAAVLEDPFDDRPFTFRPTQGDVLNWIGSRPFVDSRLRLFARRAPSIIDEHLQARAALRLPRDGTSPQRDIWQSVFDAYEINQALPRLSGRSPDYVTFYDLLNSPDWALVKLGADTAAFCRTDRSDPELAAYVAEHRRSDLVETALRTAEQDVVSELRTLWPTSPTVYSRYFYRPVPAASRPLQRARHYLALGEGQRSVDQAVAALYTAVREAHRGLAENPSDYLGYVVLGQSYATLWSFEQEVMEAAQRTYPAAMRYAQTVSAYHQAIVCDPVEPMPHLRLFGLYAQQQRHDLALKHLQEFQRLNGSLTTLPASDPRLADEQQQMEEYLAQLTSQVTEIQIQRDEDLEAGMDAAELAGRLMQSGYPLTALQLIESDLTKLSGNPQLSYLYARLLLEAGRTREAYDQFQSLKSIAEMGQLPDWGIYEAISSLVAEELYTALETLQADRLSVSTTTTLAMLYQHPLQAAARIDVSEPIDPMMPLARKLQLAAVYFDQLRPRLDAGMLTEALIDLELGKNAEAADLLQQLLQDSPLTGLRPVAETYLKLLQENPEIPPMPDVEELSSLVPDLAGLDDVDQDSSQSQQTPPAGAERPAEKAPEDTKATEDDKGPEADNGAAPQSGDAKPADADAPEDAASGAGNEAPQNDAGGATPEAKDSPAQPAPADVPQASDDRQAQN